MRAALCFGLFVFMLFVLFWDFFVLLFFIFMFLFLFLGFVVCIYVCDIYTHGGDMKLGGLGHLGGVERGEEHGQNILYGKKLIKTI